jgi:hypothetical protein
MMPASAQERVFFVVAAAAAEANSELTIILSASAECFPLLPMGHPARILLGDVRGAAERLGWKIREIEQATGRALGR